MTARQEVLTELPILIGDRWYVPEVEHFADVNNPSSGEPTHRVPMCGQPQVDAAVQAAQTAGQHWSKTPAPRRSTILFRYKALLEEHFGQLAEIITRENGKTREEARGDVRRGIEVVEFACGISHLTKGETLPQLADNIDGLTMREPVGVCAGITPFNFPAMVPLWMYPVAIACGNTFLLKPSEKVPQTANRLAELALEAGLPEGVLNVVHGGREVVEGICTHPGIAAISFVGSTRVAEHVYRLGCQHGKRVQAAGGAKNVMIVMPDAEMDSTIRAVMGASYGCAGQRCMAGSLLLSVEAAADETRQRMSQAIGQMKVASTVEDDSAQMGPLIDAAARDRAAQYINQGLEEGAELVCDGRENIPRDGFFIGPTLFDRASAEMAIFKEEIFGPVLTMLRPDDLDEAIELANRLPYGNGAVIFTQSGGAARQFTNQIQCGMVGVNVGVPAPMSIFSFSGWNQSFFGDLHVQGIEGVMFYTRQKTVLSRWDRTYQRKQGW